MTDPGATPRLPSPQPLGALGFPAGLLLVPGDAADVAAARETLAAGRLPETWPSELEGHRLVHLDRLDEAMAAFAGSDGVSAYHRWLLDPRAETAGDVRDGLPPAVAALVDVVLHTVGAIGPPCAADLSEQVAPEVRALVLAAEATGAAEAGRLGEAVAGLQEAADTVAALLPATAGVLRGTAGLLLADSGDPEGAQGPLAAALDELAGADLPEVRAELHLRLGSAAQEQAARGGDARTLLHRAIDHYYDGLKLVTEESAPSLWASLTMNLATAHLAVPMTQASDQLRLGVATQALRACRRVFTPETAPVPWSTATLNLANALVYTPSTHQADNLVEAVELYEEVLRSGVRDADPVGRARLLTNQGNALAHLGAFDEARAKLVEARFVFEEHLDHDSAATVRGILDEIAKAGVGDPDEELADLARQAEQMGRMPQSDSPYTAGMGVTMSPATGFDGGPPPKPTVTVVDPASRPAGTGAEADLEERA